MARVKRGTSSRKSRKRLLRQAKGFKWGRKSKYKAAKDALRHAWSYAYRDRKTKKREFRKLWQLQINAACRQMGTNYSKLIRDLKNKKIELNRKMLSELAKKYPEIFKKIGEENK